MKLEKIPKEFHVEAFTDEPSWGILVGSINILQSYINMIIDHINEHEKPIEIPRLTKSQLEAKKEAVEFEKLIRKRMEKAQKILKGENDG